MERSIGLVTALTPRLGYERCAAIAKEALRSGRGVVELVLEQGLLTEDEVEQLLAPEAMTGPRRR